MFHIGIEKVMSELDNLDFMLEIEDSLEEDWDSWDLVIVIGVITNRYVNPEYLLRVF